MSDRSQDASKPCYESLTNQLGTNTLDCHSGIICEVPTILPSTVIISPQAYNMQISESPNDYIDPSTGRCHICRKKFGECDHHTMNFDA